MKAKGMSPTARTMAELKARGCFAQVVERYNQYAKVRVDLFGVIDIVYIGDAITGVQTTTADHHDNRLAKILEEPRARAWIAAGGKLEIWSWTKRGAAGTRKAWILYVEEVTEAMYAAKERQAA